MKKADRPESVSNHDWTRLMQAVCEASHVSMVNSIFTGGNWDINDQRKEVKQRLASVTTLAEAHEIAKQELRR